ncbi:MAG: Lrp/AsnC family transcriptional regulator [Chlamydiales bacterium]
MPFLASFIAKNLLPYRGLGTGIRRALQHWSHIDFVEDREGCLFTSIIHRIKVHSSPGNAKKSRNKGAIKVQNTPIKAPKNAPLSPLQKQIIDLLIGNAKASYDDIAQAIGKDRSTVMRNVQKLKQDGIVRRMGSKKTGTWEVDI